MATKYKKDTDYQALIEQAAARGDYQTAAKLEQQRNAKIEGEGLSYKTTADYAGWLDKTDYGEQIRSAVASGGSKQTVADLLEQRMDKASSTRGMEQWVRDDIYDLAMDYLLQAPQLPAYESSYQSRIDGLLARLMGRGAFRYAYEEDPLYQAYAHTYQREGRRAGQDAIGLAAQNTGGYASSYASAAAQQAAGYYGSKQADKIPELYKLAYDIWLDEGEQEIAQLGVLSDLEQQEYDRYRDKIEDLQAEADREYARYMDELEAERQAEALAYDRDRDALADARYEQEWQYQLYRDGVADARYEAQQAAKAAKSTGSSRTSASARTAAAAEPAADEGAEGDIQILGLTGLYTEDEAEALVLAGIAERIRSGKKTRYKLASVS